MRLSKYELKILRCLDRPKPPRQISQELNLNFWRAGGLYSFLWRLESKGLVTSYYDEARLPERNFNRRKFYCLTRLGRNTLEGLSDANG